MLAPLVIVLVNNLKNTHNKQFNSDSQRLALSLRVELSVYGAVFKFSVCAAHTLIGRYVAMSFRYALMLHKSLLSREKSNHVSTALH